MHAQSGTSPFTPPAPTDRPPDPLGLDQPELPSTDLPPGDHPLEIAARRGIGPLSQSGRGAWHGHTEPCVSCGQLNLRGATECDACGQDLSPDMRRKMQEAAGPWFVFEHVRPFPGISWDRMLRQIKRGVITPTSIVRGPTTEFQWRFAGQTPGLASYLGLCWHCGESVSPTDRYCPACLSHLGGAAPKTLTEATVAAMALTPPKESQPDSPPASAGAASASSPSAASARPAVGDLARAVRAASAPGSARPAAPPSAASPTFTSTAPASTTPPSAARASVNAASASVNEELLALSAVLEQAEVDSGEVITEPSRVGGVRATWIIAILFVLFFAALIALVKLREDRLRSHETARTSLESDASGAAVGSGDPIDAQKSDAHFDPAPSSQP